MLAIALTAIVLFAIIIAHVALFRSPSPESSNDATQTITPMPTPILTPTPTLKSSQGIQLSSWQPPSDTIGSIVIIDSPTNNTVYSTNNVTLIVHAGIQSPYMMVDVYLETDWSNGTVLFNNMNNGLVTVSGLTITTTLTGIPEGSHTITIIANSASGSLSASSSVSFTIDTPKQSD